MGEQTDLIGKFINTIKDRYSELHIDYEYDPELDEYDIWHNNAELEFHNEEFISYVGKIARDILFSNYIYNFSFGYDYYRSKALKSNEYAISISNVDTFEVNFFDTKETAMYKIKTKGTTSGIVQKDFDITLEIEESTQSTPYLLNVTQQLKFDNSFSPTGDREVA